MPAIDGMRALAILPVIAYHANSALMPSGFLGVDVFFVISGYLITRLILGEMQRGQFSMLAFWERRVRRLLPAAICMTLACWILGFFLFLPDELQRLSKEMLAQSFFVSNIYFWIDADYFAAKSELRPLLHTWSLSVEEQFYLLAAPLLAIIWVRWKTSGLKSAVWLVTLASFSAAIIWRQTDRDATFYLLQFRAWELGLGAILVFYKPVLSKLFATTLATTGLIMLIVAYLYPESGRLPSKAALLATFATVTLIASANVSNPITRMLAIRPIVWVGLISYSLYLWHWPALSFLMILRGDMRTPQEIVAVLLLAFAAALISYYFIELPIRGRRILKERRSMFLASAIALVMTVSIAVVTLVNNGIESRWNEGSLALAKSTEHKYGRLDDCAERSIDAIDMQGYCRLGNRQSAGIGEVVIIGDSHATSMMTLFDLWSDEQNISGWQASRPRCKPLASRPKTCAPYSERVLKFVESIVPTDVVIIARWEQANGLDWYREELGSRIREIVDLGTRVWLVRQVVTPGVEVAVSLARANEFDWAPIVYPTERHMSTTRVKEDWVIANSLPFVTGIVDPVSLQCDQRRCKLSENGNVYYHDDNHLSTFGALSLADMLSPITEAILADEVESVPSLPSMDLK